MHSRTLFVPNPQVDAFVLSEGEDWRSRALGTSLLFSKCEELSEKYLRETPSTGYANNGEIIKLEDWLSRYSSPCKHSLIEIPLSSVTLHDLRNNFYLPSGPQVDLSLDYLVNNLTEALWAALNKNYQEGNLKTDMYLELQKHYLLEMSGSRYLLLQCRRQKTSWASFVFNVLSWNFFPSPEQRLPGGFALKVGDHQSYLVPLSVPEYLLVYEMLCKVSVEKYDRQHCIRILKGTVDPFLISMHLLSDDEFKSALSELHKQSFIPEETGEASQVQSSILACIEKLSNLVTSLFSLAGFLLSVIPIFTGVNSKSVNLQPYTTIDILRKFIRFRQSDYFS